MSIQRNLTNKLLYLLSEYVYAGYDMRSNDAFSGMSYMKQIEKRYKHTKFICNLLGFCRSFPDTPECSFELLDGLRKQSTD